MKHVRKEAKTGKVDAVVYVGDCMEENIDELCQLAGEIGLLGVRMFMFQEGNDTIAQNAFKEIARLTGGAYSRFDSSSADICAELLSAVAVYAAGGRAALEDFSGAKGKGPARFAGATELMPYAIAGIAVFLAAVLLLPRLSHANPATIARGARRTPCRECICHVSLFCPSWTCCQWPYTLFIAAVAI